MKLCLTCSVFSAMASVINFTHLRYLVNLEVLMVSLVFPEWPGVEVDGACVWSVVWDRDRELGGSWVPVGGKIFCNSGDSRGYS